MGDGTGRVSGAASSDDLQGSGGLQTCPESCLALSSLNWTLCIEQMRGGYNSMGTVGTVSQEELKGPGCSEKAPGCFLEDMLCW